MPSEKTVLQGGIRSAVWEEGLGLDIKDQTFCRRGKGTGGWEGAGVLKAKRYSEDLYWADLEGQLCIEIESSQEEW